MPKWNGGVIGVANNPTQSSAKGIWSLSEATKAIRAGLWPPSNAGADPYFENVTMLLSGDGTNGAQNNTFLDSSTNNFTITRNGNTTQGTFTPFSKPDGRWGNYFDGAGGSYLTTSTTSTALAMGSGEFTIEAWIYTADTSFMIACSTTSAGCGFGYNIDSGTQGLWLGRAGTGVDATSGVQLAYNTWNHVAVTRDGSNVVKFWVNGTQSGSNTTVTTNYGTSAQAVRIAADGVNAATFGLAGYVSNLRITKGAALYTGTFTPSTAPLTTTVSSGTVSLLACQSNRFIDNSVNAFTLTVAGSGTAIQTFSPFPTLTAYASGTNGGSGYFDGTGDYLSVAAASAIQFGTGDYTVEFWVYGEQSGRQDWLEMPGTNRIQILFEGTNTALYVGGSLVAGSATTPVLYQWNHVAVTRSGTNTRIFLNGTQLGSTATNSTNFSDNSLTIVDASGTADLKGYMSGLRLVKGGALYTANFTPPTSPPTTTVSSGTVGFLCNFTNGGIIDAAMSNDLETVGNAQISTTQSKFGGASMSFDGSGDYLVTPAKADIELGSGDYTIECWINISAAANNGTIVSKGPVGSLTNTVWSIEFNGSGNTLSVYVNSASGSYIINGTSNVKTSAWIHVALTRAGNNTKLFINGTQEGSTYTSGYTITAGDSLYIGGGFYAPSTRTITGYIDDLRITKGYARYTANFTAPTAPFVTFGD